jgi:hypothetical protein
VSTERLLEVIVNPAPEGETQGLNATIEGYEEELGVSLCLTFMLAMSLDGG